MDYDLIVLGAGSGGRQVALNGAAAGLKTAVVESGFLGGACVNSGCIPTKFLLGATALLPLIETQRRYGVLDGEVRFDLEKLQARKDNYLKGMRQAVQKTFEAAHVTILSGEGSFASPHSIAVKKDGQTQEYGFKHCVIATGSVPVSFPDIKADGASVHSSTGIMNLKQAPESLIVIGAGPIGLELSEFYSRFGTEISLIESKERILANDDEDVSTAMHNYLTRNGRRIYTGKRVEWARTIEGRSVVRFADGEEISAEKTLVAIGRKPDVRRLNLEAAGINIKGPGWVVADENLLAAPGIYAIGDINGRRLLANTAAHQGEYVIRHATGQSAGSYCDAIIPSCIYGHMEIMRAGPSLAELRGECAQSGQAGAVSSCQLASNPIVQSYGITQGFIKAVWVDGKLRSIVAVGHGVSSMSTLAYTLVSGSCTTAMAQELFSAHPAIDEALKSALLGLQSVL